MIEKSCFDDSFGIYIHIPFCRSKCPYCSFYSVPGRNNLHARYLQSLHRQINQLYNLPWCKERKVATIFFGGGTPTMLESSELADLLLHIQTEFFIAKNSEISIEANPATIDKEELYELHNAGFNRISIGLQSLIDKELKQLGRPHTADQGIETVKLARKAGFDNVSIDLMFGLPGQTCKSWQKTLGRGVDLTPAHLSIYELTIEEKTPFHDLVRQRSLFLPPEQNILEMMELTAELTSAAGYNRYEISNFSRPARECLHNINYWHNASYLGLGAGAVSYLSGRRLPAIADIDAFCKAVEHGDEVWESEEKLDLETRFRETVIMGLRMTAGVNLLDLGKRFDIDLLTYYGNRVTRLEKLGLLVLEQDQMRLSNQGLRLANSVMAELV